MVVFRVVIGLYFLYIIKIIVILLYFCYIGIG